MPKKQIIIVNVILIIILLGFFFYLNIDMFNKKDMQNIPTTKITTTKSKEKLLTDKILLDGEEKTIYVREYASHLGFSLKYEEDIFDLKYLSDGSLILTDKEDNKNMVKIENLQEKDYYEQYDVLSLQDFFEDNYVTNYVFLRGSSYNYLKVTKTIDSNNTSISNRIDYIISSLTFNNN